MPAIVCHLKHLARLNLLHVERKAVSQARLGVVKPERQFVKLESAVRKPFSISGIAEGSNGWIRIVCASGTDNCATWFSGISDP